MDPRSESSAIRPAGRHHVAPHRWTMDDYTPGHHQPGPPRTLLDHLTRRWAMRNGWAS